MFKVLIMFHFYTNFKKGSNENKTSTQDTIRKGSRKKYGTITKQNDLRMIKCPKYKRLYVEYTTLYIDIAAKNVHVRHTTVPAISFFLAKYRSGNP